MQDIFIRAVFGKRRSLSSLLDNNQTVTDSATRGTGGGGEDKGSDSGTASLPEPVRIIHKEQDSISAFCLNQVCIYCLQKKYFVIIFKRFFCYLKVNAGQMALATPREVQEMDISLLLELPSWLEDECEFDIINLKQQIDQESIQPTSFLVIQVKMFKFFCLFVYTICRNGF